ncbi:hypothetical protein [Mesorhizobium sp. M0140]|uniref:GAP1-N1 domain-containing protein n=1 Tax=Mesorhizobium sp. M0140 TaxID=2956893 RepID=UPI00333C50D3
MNDLLIHQQKHGYRNGHQLLESTVRLERSDQDVVDRLSDLSGQIRPGEVIPPYLTIYPLPSRAYHVVARTWPDLTAPRAGCVLTRSLLIPRRFWHENAHLQWLLRQLPHPDDNGLLPIVGKSAEEPIPPLVDPRTPELVEALFLEARKPLVVFDAIDAELLATRLLTAFWPAFRNEFSICTYALGPRKIGGRDFDLVFAPKSARSKFSNWSGRKIEAGSPKSPRHRWSTAIADAILQSAHPTLASGDALGLLGTGGAGDEAAFRKSLLWNELAEKAPISASAVLGMLDIVNSQPGLASHAMRSSRSLLVSAISSAVESMPSADAWTFLETLAGKVRDRNDLEPLGVEAGRDAEELAASDPDAAIEFSRRFQDASDLFPTDIMQGLANGLGAADGATIDYRRIPPWVGTFLVANSSVFAEAAARRIRTGETPALDLVPYLQTGDVIWRDKAARRLVSEIDSREFAPLVSSILHRSTGDDLAGRVAEIVRRSGLAFPEFDEALVDAIRDEATMLSVRGVVAQELKGSNADRFLAKTIRLVPNDIDWLFDGPIEGSRSAALLSTVIESQSDRSVIEAQRDPTIRRKMLDTLARDVEATAPQIARILVLGAVSVEDLLEFAQLALGVLRKGRLRSEIINTALERGLFEAMPADRRVELLVTDHFDEVGARQMIWWSIADGVSTPRLAQNLSILARLPDAQKELLANCIDNLSDRLSRRGPNGLDEKVCEAWARLLWDARAISPMVHLRAATTSMSATIELTRSPVAEVLAAAFPTVYQELASRNNRDNDGILGLVFALPRMLVNDWDRAKPARHGLVDAFMSSDWPPSYLLLAAARAGILDRICLRVLRQRGGKKYLNRAVADLGRLTPDQVTAIRKRLDHFAKSDMENEWD